MKFLTLRETRGACNAKAWLADGTVRQYDRGFLWHPEEREAANLEELAALLFELGDRRDVIVVRGAEKTPGRTPILRRIIGDEADLVDADRDWICGDVDGVAVPEGLRAVVEGGGWGGRPMRLIESAAVAHAVLAAELPAWLAKAGCVWQWSGSAGRDGWAKLKAHVWWPLARPVCSASLAEWGASQSVLDRAGLRPVQPLYTAQPLIEDGFADAPRAWVQIVPGPPAEPPRALLSLADHAAKERLEAEERRAAAERRTAALAYTSPMAVQSQHLAALSRLTRYAERKILGAGEGQRHDSILKAATAVARLADEHRLDATDALDRVEAAARTALGAKRAKEVTRIMETVRGRG